MAYTPDPTYSQERFTADAVRTEADAEGTLEATRAQEAAAEGVRDARFIGYAEVLDVYNQRSDTEPLADRRARHLAADPTEQDFTRRADWTGNSTVTQTPNTAPGGQEWADGDDTDNGDPVDPDDGT